MPLPVCPTEQPIMDKVEAVGDRLHTIFYRQAQLDKACAKLPAYQQAIADAQACVAEAQACVTAAQAALDTLNAAIADYTTQIGTETTVKDALIASINTDLNNLTPHAGPNYVAPSDYPDPVPCDC